MSRRIPNKLGGPSRTRHAGFPVVFSRLSPAKPTKVYDTYWFFAAERQAIFFRRARGEAPPWTEDRVLAGFKFTNAYRASDRVSQYLIRKVIYEGDQSRDEIFFRIVLFKLFNRVGTWELLKEHFGDVSLRTYSYRAYDRVLTAQSAEGGKLYSAAYIMPTGGIRGQRKHRMHLKLLERMVSERVADRISECKSMGAAFDLLASYPTIGDFLAYQYVTDINYSGLTNFTEMEFTVPGPGARSGIKKCFSDLGGLTEAEIIKLVTEQQDVEFERRGIEFETLWGRRLQLIDCQNLFCEVDKYARVRHPDIIGTVGRTRIKQTFAPTGTIPQCWFPPKWGLNAKVRSWYSALKREGHLNGG
jgi:hypothetical protein